MTTVDGLKIADIMNKKNHMDHNNWKIFLHDVTTILNYDTPTHYEEYWWRIRWGPALGCIYRDIHYTSYIDRSCQQLCRDLLGRLANPGDLENLRGMIEEHPYLLNTPSKVTREYNGKEKTYKDDSKVTISIGAASLTRPSSGRREFNGNFNAETVTGASPREVLREYMMHV
jgi:hypothetical protein